MILNQRSNTVKDVQNAERSWRPTLQPYIQAIRLCICLHVLSVETRNTGSVVKPITILYNMDHTDLSSLIPRPRVTYKVNGNTAKRIGDNIVFNQTVNEED